jgi:hypothetical protein
VWKYFVMNRFGLPLMLTALPRCRHGNLQARAAARNGPQARSSLRRLR